jgi:hypothetical protein
MNDDEQDVVLRSIERKQDFIMERLGYNPHTMQPHGNGLLGRIAKIEKQLEKISPSNLVKTVAALAAAILTISAATSFLMEHIK